MVPGETSQMMSSVAKDLSIYLCGGSIPEEENGKLYNTSLVYGPSGDLIAKHQKVNYLSKIVNHVLYFGIK